MIHRSILSITLLFASLGILTISAGAQAPPGYYDTVDATNAIDLRSTLHDVIDDHQRFPYTSSATDTWNILELADEDPTNSGRVLDVYKNASYAKVGAGNSFYNREHSWPKSYGFPNDNSSNYPYTDCHHLFISDSGYNSSRSNKPYRSCDAACTEKVTDVNFGQGGGSGFYPGNSNWTSGSLTAGTWEVWVNRRGDIARALLYMDVRYEGGTHAVTGVSEPDLILTDVESLIASSNTGSNGNVAYMGMLSVLLQWHASDPVDSLELWRNDQIYNFQGNRNPFIDHPEWVDCLFSGSCGGGGDVTPPSAPTGLNATAGPNQVSLNWNGNGEPDLQGYHVYRSLTSGSSYSRLTGAALATNSYVDSAAVGGTTYFYSVSAIDTSANESSLSGEASATPTTGGNPPTDPWINELHYDNASSDVGEMVEVAGATGLDLTGWTLVAYNGNGGASYKTVNLSGTLPDQGGCIGTLSFAFTSMQNGAPDGMALVDAGGTTVEFISYEGSLTATNGPASGLTSTSIGVSETSSTPAGQSLQLAGTGSSAADFTWQAPQGDTPGLPNVGQTFSGGCGGGGNPVPPGAPAGLAASAGEGQVSLSWIANTEPDLTGYNVYRSLVSGSGFGQLNGALVTGTSYQDSSASNGTTYFYVVTAFDSELLESVFSNEASGTPADSTAPSSPTGLLATAGDGVVSLDWADNTEPDLTGYWVYRSEASGGSFTALNSSLVTTSFWDDTTAMNGVLYFYVVTASDNVGNESGISSEASATPSGGGVNPTGDVWINELHYDNASTDVGEMVEVAGAAGLDLTGWQLVAYNGSGGASYKTVNLNGTIPDQGGCVGTLSFAFTSMQNGAPDGIALVDSGGAVVEFLSYEGVFTATNGPASGITSTDMGVSETSSTPVGQSLQRAGTGSTAADFTWQPPALDTPGLPNNGQVFSGGCGSNPIPPGAPTGLAAVASDGLVDLNWSANPEPDVTGYNVYRSLASGTGYSLLNGTPLAGTSYQDATVINDTTYFYVVTAFDSELLEGNFSAEVSATPAGAGGGGPTVLAFDDFEAGWGNYTDGGRDCRRYTGGTHAWEANAAINIQDNSGVSSSFTLTNGIDVATPGYTSIEVNFHYKGVSMENNEDFWVQYFDGSTWQTVATYVRGVDFNNNVFNESTVLITESNNVFPTDMKIRFRCDASGNKDDVYIDAITITAQ